MRKPATRWKKGILVSWKVKEGDHIKVGQSSCEIETDKARLNTNAGRRPSGPHRGPGTGVVPIKQPIAFLAETMPTWMRFCGWEAPPAAIHRQVPLPPHRPRLRPLRRTRV